ncbi:MAG: tripartite tricarboxylate transporter TctB family protein [Betaproteobacteria bacterium]|jgi:putative tricarboxylic transport membrane protein
MDDDGSADIDVRGPELAVAALLLGVGGLVVADSLRIGVGWADDGPLSGTFPFYVGLVLIASAAWVVLGQFLRWRAGTAEAFFTRAQAALVWAMLWPIVVYVGAVQVLGIYVASALLIGYFMARHGRYRWTLTVPVAVGVPLVFFVVFERWFLVPLAKGPLERLLGL